MFCTFWPTTKKKRSYNCDCMFLNHGIILKITLSAFFECKIFLMILYHASTASQTSKKRFCLRLSPYVGYFFHRANVTERNMNHLPISRSIIILHQIYNTKNINSESSFVSMQYTSSCWYYWQFVRCITHTQVHYTYNNFAWDMHLDYFGWIGRLSDNRRIFPIRQRNTFKQTIDIFEQWHYRKRRKEDEEKAHNFFYLPFVLNE